jgi:hypothetical protein
MVLGKLVRISLFALLIYPNFVFAPEIFPTSEELPPKLWDMLIQRCPSLEELTLCSFSASHCLMVLDNITQGLWPSLNSITLGSFGYNADLCPPHLGLHSEHSSPSTHASPTSASHGTSNAGCFPTRSPPFSLPQHCPTLTPSSVFISSSGNSLCPRTRVSRPSILCVSPQIWIATPRSSPR